MASLNDIETKVQYIIGLLDARTTKTITGVLPLTFTTTEDKLRDWEIRGNDDIYDGQQGVGQRTENLWDKGYPIYNYISDYKKYNAANAIELLAGTYRIASDVKLPTLQVFDSNHNQIVPIGDAIELVGQSYYIGWDDYALLGASASSTSAVIQLKVDAIITLASPVADGHWIMVTKGSTAPSSYVPFGYEIPLTVNGTPQTFYIGDSPLTAGQSISKTSTGVDIATTEGENTISTTLYNKPEMTIKYK